MRSAKTEPFATRLSVQEAELIQNATEQTDLSRSDLLALAFRWYMAENPDDIPAFCSAEPVTDALTELEILPPMTESGWAEIEDR